MKSAGRATKNSPCRCIFRPLKYSCTAVPPHLVNNTMKKITSIEQGLLKQSLQSMTEADNGVIQGIFVFPPDFPAFDGHFPGQPVLPAIAQLAAVRLLAAKHLGRDLTAFRLDRAKFKSMVSPD